MAAQIGRYVTCRVSLRRVLAGRCGLDHLASFGKVSGIVVDVCARHGTWFDVGELARVLSFVVAGGMQRASAVQLEERQRLSHAQTALPPHAGLAGLECKPNDLSWADMQEAAVEFVDWARHFFRH